jgi:hypothetical protein
VELIVCGMSGQALHVSFGQVEHALPLVFRHTTGVGVAQDNIARRGIGRRLAHRESAEGREGALIPVAIIRRRSVNQRLVATAATTLSSSGRGWHAGVESGMWDHKRR